MVICLERDADLHMAQLMPKPLTFSCFIKIQTGFNFLVAAQPGSFRPRQLNGCVRACVSVCVNVCNSDADQNAGLMLTCRGCSDVKLRVILLS